MTQSIKTLLVTFPYMPLRYGDIRYLRSLINDVLDWKEPIFHNHKPEGGEIYRYPLVQYRVHKGVACLFGIEEGCKAISKLLSEYHDELPEEMTASMEIDTKQTDVKMLDTPIRYQIRYFLPFNTDNFEEWNKVRSLVEKIQFLERNIVGHLLAFCQDINFRVPDKSLIVEIEAIDDLDFVEYPAMTGELKLRAFNIIYHANIQLPDKLGIGKGKSKGYGVQTTTDIGLQSKTYKSIRNTETYLKKHRKTTN